uniref:Candidate secreted effector n=1 Tax=Meloidogyne incognita TaxID=6306 RepID=A0A914MJ67_MELIC
MLAILISASILFLSFELLHTEALPEGILQNSNLTSENQIPNSLHKEKECRCTYPAKETINLTELPLRVLKRSCGGCCCCCRPCCCCCNNCGCCNCCNPCCCNCCGECQCIKWAPCCCRPCCCGCTGYGRKMKKFRRSAPQINQKTPKCSDKNSTNSTDISDKMNKRSCCCCNCCNCCCCVIPAHSEL